MKVYRITRKKYAEELNGVGASLSTINRWNSKGTEMIYTAGSEALARAELAGHINLSLLSDPVLMEIDVDVANFYEPQLPPNWDVTPPGSHSKIVGDRFILEGKNLMMKVPSKYDHLNYLINPSHPEFKRKVQITKIIELNPD